MSRPTTHDSPASKASSRSSTSSGSPGSSCSTTRCSRSRACARRGARHRFPRAFLPPGRSRGLGGLDRLLPHRALASIRCRTSSRSAQPRAGLDPGHRPRLPARHPREAHRPRDRALRARSRRARCELRDVPLARRHPRRREGARPPVRRARAARAVRRLEREARGGGGRAAPGR